MRVNGPSNELVAGQVVRGRDGQYFYVIGPSRAVAGAYDSLRAGLYPSGGYVLAPGLHYLRPGWVTEVVLEPVDPDRNRAPEEAPATS
jgi:hypothetical protein